MTTDYTDYKDYFKFEIKIFNSEFHSHSELYCSYLKFSDLKASKPAVRKLGRRR
ncbi:MAG: hypothetical protein LBP59_05710 [Planctomycetaceae bacterium]|nr:hypothetical protein [Planctomycetaceae bacterium]